MQIYVVQNGDTLYKIAKIFNTTPEIIASANELPQPDVLLVGQALVIPVDGNYYYVKRGDSLWSIGRKFGIEYNELAKINLIDINKPLNIGLRLFIPPLPKYTIVSNAYIEPLRGQASEPLLKDTNKAAPVLTYLTTFSYKANSDGTLEALNLTGITEIAKANNNKLMMAITNISSGSFSAEVAKSILESKEIQQSLISNIIIDAKKVEQISDIHFDFEYIPPSLRDAYSTFIALAVQELHTEGYMVSVALAPKTSANQQGQWYQGHDYGALGATADFVVVMSYEWGYSAGPPQPVSPIGPVEKVLQYAISEIPSNKILMGQNLYGYDWTIPYIQGGEYAKALSPQLALEIARQNMVAIQYDYRAQAPFFYYTKNGARHIVWFEDARSIQAKFNLLKRLNLRGISYWKLGLPFPQNWLLLNSNFNIIEY
jgi:spore germination protein